MPDVRRRELIALLGGAAAAWPVGAWTQQAAMPVIGFLSLESPGRFTHLVAAFRRGLGEAGYVEHRSVSIDYGWAEGRADRLPALAASSVFWLGTSQSRACAIRTFRLPIHCAGMLDCRA